MFFGLAWIFGWEFFILDWNGFFGLAWLGFFGLNCFFFYLLDLDFFWIGLDILDWNFWIELVFFIGLAWI